MTTLPKSNWITGDEYSREWQRLQAKGVEASESEAAQLLERLGRRNDELFERYGRPLIQIHPEKWVAISADGEVLIRDQSWQARKDGEAAFGAHNFAVRKLNEEFQGHMIHH